MNYPTIIETARLRLRALVTEDAETWSEFLSHPVATRFLLPALAPEPRAWAEVWIGTQHGRYADGRYGLLAAEFKQEPGIVGQCGLLNQHVDGRDELEVGYHFLPAHWRKGLASEAAQAMRDWGFRHTDAASIISIIHRDNVASQGVALKNGMQREKACEFKGLPVYVYRIHRSEWEQGLGA